MSAIPKQRFLALDIFRGMTVAFMIMVNNHGAHSFAEMRHADWHGFTLTDLVWPSFLFAVGSSLAFAKDKWNTMPQKEVVFQILKRTFLIFLLGYLMYWFPFVEFNSQHEWVFKPISETRFLGVLQRIALCYGSVALLVYYTSTRTLIITSVVFLVGYWLVMASFGDLSIPGNIASIIDRAVLTPAHMYHKGAEGYDACGILGTFPAIVNTIAGYLCGYYIRRKPKGYEMLTKIALAGFLCLVVAYFWNLVFPYNKKIWTSSYVMLTIGIDCFIILTLIYIVDFMGKRNWGYYFEVFGKNPLFIYLLSELLPRLLGIIPVGDKSSAWEMVYKGFFGPLFSDGLVASLLYSISYMFFCWLIGYWMDKKKIYIRL